MIHQFHQCNQTLHKNTFKIQGHVRCLCEQFFLKSFWRTYVLFWGHRYPCFGFLEWVLPYLLFCRGECNVHSPRFTSGTTLADLLASGVQPVTSPHAWAEVGLCLDLNEQSPGQKTNALPFMPVTRLSQNPRPCALSLWTILADRAN